MVESSSIHSCACHCKLHWCYFLVHLEDATEYLPSHSFQSPFPCSLTVWRIEFQIIPFFASLAAMEVGYTDPACK